MLGILIHEEMSSCLNKLPLNFKSILLVDSTASFIKIVLHLKKKTLKTSHE